MLKNILIAFVILVVLGTIFFYWAGRASRSVHISRTFDAPVERVWAKWTDPDSIKQWWGPKDYTAPVIQNDARLGGNFLFAMKSPSGETHYNSGTYTDIALNKKIVSKMQFADETGKAVDPKSVGIPGDWPEFVMITVEFTEKDGGQKTQIDVTETGIPLIMSVFAKMGWEQQFDKFEHIVKPQ